MTVSRKYTAQARHCTSCEYLTWYDIPDCILFCAFSVRSAVRNRNITSLYAIDINTLQEEAVYFLNVDSHFKQNITYGHYVLQTVIIRLFCSPPYDRSIAPSKASSLHSTIQCFLFQSPASSCFLKVIQQLPTSSSMSSRHFYLCYPFSDLHQKAVPPRYVANPVSLLYFYCIWVIPLLLDHVTLHSSNDRSN